MQQRESYGTRNAKHKAKNIKGKMGRKEHPKKKKISYKKRKPRRINQQTTN